MKIVFMLIFLFAVNHTGVNPQIVVNSIHEKVILDSISKIVDIPYIKNKYEKYSTSTILNKQFTKYFPKTGEGFYGLYTFLDPLKKEFICELIIHSAEKEWFYENKSDDFVEITIYQPGISILNNIEIGFDVSILENQLGKDYDIYNDIYIYKNRDEGLMALIKIENEKITWIRLGNYNQDILDNFSMYSHFLLR